MISFKKATKCPDHPSYTLDYFCEDDCCTCCFACLFGGKHQGHRHIRYAQNGVVLKGITDVLKESVKTALGLKASRKAEADAEKRRIEEEFELAKLRAEEKTIKLQKMIKEDVQELRGKIEEEIEKLTNNTTEVRDMISEYFTKRRERNWTDKKRS